VFGRCRLAVHLPSETELAVGGLAAVGDQGKAFVVCGAEGVFDVGLGFGLYSFEGSDGVVGAKRGGAAARVGCECGVGADYGDLGIVSDVEVEWMEDIRSCAC